MQWQASSGVQPPLLGNRDGSGLSKMLWLAREVWGVGDGSISKLFATEAQGSEF